MQPHVKAVPLVARHLAHYVPVLLFPSASIPYLPGFECYALPSRPPRAVPLTIGVPSLPTIWLTPILPLLVL